MRRRKNKKHKQEVQMQDPANPEEAPNKKIAYHLYTDKKRISQKEKKKKKDCFEVYPQSQIPKPMKTLLKKDGQMNG
ncbi:uncharacterized protein EAF02_010115 [Botrytis sinoallii]|uniref:uncharacterized protein n=1 Tax=Botrytis sinoallii TaxID=1463999 RepID=UPI001901E190|nr:uncharacterized protein EAF02_010115 [Botrytis sinoallii]KAF7864147.1 hypothetical protein EAF02_010115 [Botrytis sinoallii]